MDATQVALLSDESQQHTRFACSISIEAILTSTAAGKTLTLLVLQQDNPATFITPSSPAMEPLFSLLEHSDLGCIQLADSCRHRDRLLERGSVAAQPLEHEFVFDARRDLVPDFLVVVVDPLEFVIRQYLQQSQSVESHMRFEAHTHTPCPSCTRYKSFLHICPFRASCMPSL